MRNRAKEAQHESELRAMGSTSPESSKLTSRFRIGAFGVLVLNESRELDLFGGEDVQRKKVRKIIFSSNDTVEDRIVRDAQVSPEHANKGIFLHLHGEGCRRLGTG